MFIMAYGGLRGAVSFAMVSTLVILPEKHKEVFHRYLGTTLAVILGTVFVQGSTIKFFVTIMNFKERQHKENYTTTTIKRVNFHILAGMEAILGGGSSRIHFWLEKFERFDKKHIQPILCVSKEHEAPFDVLQMEGLGLEQKLGRDHMMWGAIHYAREKVAMSTDQRRKCDEKCDVTKTKDVSKFKNAISNQVPIAGHHRRIPSPYGSCEEMNQAWKRKLDLMRAVIATTQAYQKATEENKNQKMEPNGMVNLREIEDMTNSQLSRQSKQESKDDRNQERSHIEGDIESITGSGNVDKKMQ